MPCRVCTSSSKRDNEKFHVLDLFILSSKQPQENIGTYQDVPFLLIKN